MTSLLIAIGFLTVLPVPARTWTSSTPLGHAFSWFPLVGLLVGGILAAVAVLLAPLLPASVTAALLVALGVFLTGGLHMDGLMDTCDGVFVMRSPEQRLAIMRDSHVGAFGVLGALSVLLVKYGALVALAGGPHDRLIGAAVLACVVSRWSMVQATVWFPYGRSGQSLGATFQGDVGRRQFVTATVVAAACVVLLSIVCGLGVWGWAAWGGAAVLTYGIARFVLGRLPGLTGDIYGAINEVVEAALLVAFTVGM